MLFMGMLAVLVGQANTEEETEWSPQGGYGYFETTTVAQTLHVLSQAMAGAGAVVALTFTRWVVKTLVRLSKTGSTA